jgi:hypothetical protein
MQSWRPNKKAVERLKADGFAARNYQTTLVSFATREFRPQQILLSQSAIEVGIDYVACWNEERLEKTAFFSEHNEIFQNKRGFGCWLWKPYVISYELSRIQNGSFLIYWDVGRKYYGHRFEQSPDPLLFWCAKENNGVLPGVYVPQYGPNKRWTKRDCFVAMNCDSVEYWDHPQIQATFSIWQNNGYSVEFVTEWLDWSQRAEVIIDGPNRLGLNNFDGFVAHRHDQSVLTNLVIKHGLKCFGNIDSWLPGDADKDINNLIDRVMGYEDRIARRELRKKWRVIRKKASDLGWWKRRFERILLHPKLD